MTQAAIRRRTREPETLPPLVINYINENFTDGRWPGQDPVAILLMMERCFSARVYKEHRHHVLDRMFRGGMSLPQIAIVFDRSERTIWAWKSEMRDYLGQGFALKTVREIHEEAMTDFDVQMSLCDKIIHSSDASIRDVAIMMRTKQRWYALKEQVKRNSGFYSVFDVGKMKNEDSDRVTEAEKFLEWLDRALLDKSPTFQIEGPREEAE